MGEVVVMEEGAGAAETAAGSRRTASRRTRTQAAAGTACRRPPRGLSNVSHDRIHGRPPSFRRPHTPPTLQYRIWPVLRMAEMDQVTIWIARELVQKFRGKSNRIRKGSGCRIVVGSGKLSDREKRETTRRARESVEKVAACTEHKSPGRRVAMDWAARQVREARGGRRGGPTWLTWALALRLLSLRVLCISRLVPRASLLCNAVGAWPRPHYRTRRSRPSATMLTFHDENFNI